MAKKEEKPKISNQEEMVRSYARHHSIEAHAHNLISEHHAKRTRNLKLADQHRNASQLHDEAHSHFSKASQAYERGNARHGSDFARRGHAAAGRAEDYVEEHALSHEHGEELYDDED